MDHADPSLGTGLNHFAILFEGRMPGQLANDVPCSPDTKIITSPLPTPVSPSISTVAERGAMRLICEERLSARSLSLKSVDRCCRLAALGEAPVRVFDSCISLTAP